MIRKSKVGKRGGSINATIPLAIADLFGIKEGDTLRWVGDINIDEGRKSLCIEKEETILAE